jgi:signal transduction histidine kinase
MKIKNRLSIYFTAISGVILLLMLAFIYFAYEKYSKADFFVRLKERNLIVAQLYLKADEVSQDSINKIKEKFLQKIPGEIFSIYDSSNADAFIKNNEEHWNKTIIEKVRQKKYLQYTNHDRQVVGIYYKDNQGYFVILLSAIDTGTMIRTERLRNIMIIAFISICLVSFFSSQFIAKKALQPLNDVIARMQEIRASNLNLRVENASGNDEISILAKNFNSLLEHLENAFELQKLFVANASHELRTPLTTIMGVAEVALIQERSVKEYESSFLSIISDTEKLKNTISALMNLAQADMNFSEATLKPVRLDDLLWELQEIWNERFGKNSLNVKFPNLPEDEHYLTLNANKALLIIAFNNIISNAFKFSDNKPVECIFSSIDQTISIAISDKGIGISKNDMRNIFKPFYRTANAQEFEGSGIGLHIANKIINLHKGTISVKLNKEAGTTFTVELSI